MEFADRLKELRLNNGLTQIELSKRLNYSQSIISEWEKNGNQPTAQAIKTIAKFFNVSADYLLGCENEFGIKDFDEPLPYSPDELQLIAAYREMSQGKKQALFSMLDISTKDRIKKGS